jgi:uncharacterized membrane-anchored protein
MKLFLPVFLVLFSLNVAAQESDIQPVPESESPASPQPTAAAAETKVNTAEAFLASLEFRSGKILLDKGIATIDLPENFRFLSPKDAEKLLVEGWGNPPGNTTLGMVVPKDVNLLSEGGWGVVVTYDEDGFIKDEDADKIDYEDLLKDMKDESKDYNEERIKQGYGSMLLVGWAEAPRYDKQTKKLFWAKEYSTERQGENSLNYNIRVLGRKGVLVLNAIASMNQIAKIKSEMPYILAVTEFNPGNRYEDFDSKTDHVAEYGIAALVAGGVAAKLGLFAKFAGILLALKKFLVLGVIGLFALVKKVFGKKSE